MKPIMELIEQIERAPGDGPSEERILKAFKTCVQALEFYADRSNWEANSVPHIHSFIADFEHESPGTYADQHGGRRARQALQSAAIELGAK